METCVRARDSIAVLMLGTFQCSLGQAEVLGWQRSKVTYWTGNRGGLPLIKDVGPNVVSSLDRKGM